jgi:hypothetical protein
LEGKNVGRADIKGMSDRGLLELVEQRTYHIEEKLDRTLRALDRLAGMVP